MVIHIVMGEHGAWRQLRRVECAAAEEARRRRVHHGRNRVVAIGGIHGGCGSWVLRDEG